MGRSPGEGNGDALQYLCLENCMDSGAWWVQSMRSQRVRHNWATKRTHTYSFPQGLSWWFSGKGSTCHDVGFRLGQADSLEKEMVTHSVILAWRIPWTEEPRGPQSMGSQRVRQELLTLSWLHYYHLNLQSLLNLFWCKVWGLVQVTSLIWLFHCSNNYYMYRLFSSLV